MRLSKDIAAFEAEKQRTHDRDVLDMIDTTTAYLVATGIAAQSLAVGYLVSTEVTGGGVGTAAVALGLDHSFGPVGLHRVEATVRPENVPSRKVLAKVGFREEGLLRRYLNVDGGWRDHLLVALTVEEVDGSVAAALVRRRLAAWH